MAFAATPVVAVLKSIWLCPLRRAGSLRGMSESMLRGGVSTRVRSLHGTGDRPDASVVDVDGLGGGGGDELRGGLGPGEGGSWAMVTFIYREILCANGQVRTFCKGRWLLENGFTNRFPGPSPLSV